MNTSLYLLIDNNPQGPFSLPEVESMWDAGQVTDNTLCAGEGGSEWVPLRGWIAAYKEQGKAITSDARAAPAAVPRWHMMLTSGMAGPFTLGEVQHAVNSTLANGATLICQEGAAQWAPVMMALPQISYPKPVVPAKSLGGSVVGFLNGTAQAGVFVLGVCLILFGAISCLTFIGVLWGLPMIAVGALCLFLVK